MEKHQDIINSILNGDTAAFRWIIENNQRLVGHIVFRMIPVEADRQDVCQDIFLKVYKNLSHFRFKSKLSTWIAQISYHHCLNYLEKKKLLLLNDIAGDGSIENFSVSEETPDMYAEKADISELMQKEIGKLPPQFRTILTLYHMEEMSYKEISKITSMPEGTVKSYLFRARKLLKDKLLMRYGQEALC